eukprot:TRINITY_DN39368_c0_g1_i1.p1 TRINITY_DN39368_c0_g1~~TRINITY_DN39368_c0_g1_i1.p1  ORF type:complete len:307 (-),score=82.10 TRINITY_DN39368_c0_g1_i1:103-1023(-)
MGQSTDEELQPRLGIYSGRSSDYSCPGDHVTWEIVLLEGGRCTIDCRSELSPSKGGTQAWHIEGSWEWVEDDAEVIVVVTKEDPSGGPRSDRDLTLDVSEDMSALTFKKACCAWTSPPPDAFLEALAALSLKELKAKAEASGLDPAGCIEREEFISLLQRAKVSGVLKENVKDNGYSRQPDVPKVSTVAESSKEPEVPPALATPAPAVSAASGAPAAPPAAAAAATPAPATSEPVQAATTEDMAGCYTLEQLTDKRVWEKLDVVATERETYLPESVFSELFGMSKADFAKLPKWKKENAKKKHGLF